MGEREERNRGRARVDKTSQVEEPEERHQQRKEERAKVSTS